MTEWLKEKYKYWFETLWLSEEDQKQRMNELIEKFDNMTDKLKYAFINFNKEEKTKLVTYLEEKSKEYGVEIKFFRNITTECTIIGLLGFFLLLLLAYYIYLHIYARKNNNNNNNIEAHELETINN